MRPYFVAYGAAAVAFLALDAIWLSSTVGRLYRPAIGSMMAPQPVLWAAIAFYALYILGIVVLAITPALGAGIGGAVWRGAVLGLVAYGTYDLTNQAVMRGWPAHLTFIDLAWGTFVTAAGAGAGAAAARWIGPG